MALVKLSAEEMQHGRSRRRAPHTHLSLEGRQPLEVNVHAPQQLLLRQRARQRCQHLRRPRAVCLPRQRHDAQRQVGAGGIHAGLAQVGRVVYQSSLHRRDGASDADVLRHLQRQEVRGPGRRRPLLPLLSRLPLLRLCCAARRVVHASTDGEGGDDAGGRRRRRRRRRLQPA